MNRIILFCLVLLLASCLKDDLPPVIVLNNPDYKIRLGEAYSEPGASATDNEDGLLDSTNIVIDASEVNTDSTALYEVLYTISDNAGNEGRRKRELLVYPLAYHYAGNYDITETCRENIFDSVIFNYTVSLYEGADSNKVLLTNLRETGMSDSIVLNLSGALFDNFTLSDSIGIKSFGGNGKLELGTVEDFELSLNYSVSDTLQTLTCKSILNRQ